MNASTVDVACPRCDVPIVCTLEITPLPPTPGQTVMAVTAKVPDLAERFAAHYRDAGHVPTPTERFARAFDRAADAAGRAQAAEVKLADARTKSAAAMDEASRAVAFAGQKAGEAVSGLMEMVDRHAPLGHPLIEGASDE